MPPNLVPILLIILAATSAFFVLNRKSTHLTITGVVTHHQRRHRAPHVAGRLDSAGGRGGFGGRWATDCGALAREFRADGTFYPQRRPLASQVQAGSTDGSIRAGPS